MRVWLEFASKEHIESDFFMNSVRYIIHREIPPKENVKCENKNEER